MTGEPDTLHTASAAPSPAIAIEEVNASRLPVSVSELVEFLDARYAACESMNDLIAEILKLLSAKSSKFKYIVNTTSVSVNETANNQIKSSFGSLWDEKNDGLLNFRYKVSDTQWILLNIIFISVA